MIFETHVPDKPFGTYIESLMHFKHFMPDHSIEWVVSTGHIYVLFELDGMVRNTFDSDDLKPNAEFTRAWISGMHRNYISISAHEDSEMFVLQFKPFGCYPFSHIPSEQLNEKITPIENVLGSDLIELRETMLHTGTSNEKFALMEEWLAQRFDETKTPPPELIEFIESLQQEPVANLNQLIESYPATQKTLIEQFKRYVGLTPKYYQRILRFNDILQRIHQKENICWSNIAHDCGYSDQPHFIKEFKHFSGFNPQEFISQDFNREDTNFFPLDREDPEENNKQT